MTAGTEINWLKELDRLAREAEPAVLAKAGEVFAEAVAEHERQTAGYSFECRRWGDFLTVYVGRDGNEKDWGEDEPLRRFSTSLNIGETREIQLRNGHCFDRRGLVRYQAWMKSDDEKGGGSWGTGMGFSAPPKGYHYEVEPCLPYIPRARKLVEVRTDKDKDHGRWHDRGARPAYATENYPRPAKDDEIHFIGINATIFAPAGKGQAVYDAIMAEIERGHDRPSRDTRRMAETGTGSVRSTSGANSSKPNNIGETNDR